MLLGDLGLLFVVGGDLDLSPLQCEAGLTLVEEARPAVTLLLGPLWVVECLGELVPAVGAAGGFPGVIGAPQFPLPGVKLGLGAGAPCGLVAVDGGLPAEEPAEGDAELAGDLKVAPERSVSRDGLGYVGKSTGWTEASTALTALMRSPVGATLSHSAT